MRLSVWYPTSRLVLCRVRRPRQRLQQRVIRASHIYSVQWRSQDFANGKVVLPIPYLSLHSSFPFLPPFSPPSPSFPSPSLQLGGLGERCKLPQRGLGEAPAEVKFRAFFNLKFWNLVAPILLIYLRRPSYVVGFWSPPTSPTSPLGYSVSIMCSSGGSSFCGFSWEQMCKFLKGRRPMRSYSSWGTRLCRLWAYTVERTGESIKHFIFVRRVTSAWCGGYWSKRSKANDVRTVRWPRTKHHVLIVVRRYKSFCLRIGPRHDVQCGQVMSSSWSNNSVGERNQISRHLHYTKQGI